MNNVPNNKVMKNQYIQFVIFVHQDLVKTNFGMARHDCLGYLIRDIFHLSNKLGMQMELVSAVSAEAYEKAARFRDRINLLKEELNALTNNAGGKE